MQRQGVATGEPTHSPESHQPRQALQLTPRQGVVRSQNVYSSRPIRHPSPNFCLVESDLIKSQKVRCSGGSTPRQSIKLKRLYTDNLPIIIDKLPIIQ